MLSGKNRCSPQNFVLVSCFECLLRLGLNSLGFVNIMADGNLVPPNVGAARRTWGTREATLPLVKNARWSNSVTVKPSSYEKQANHEDEISNQSGASLSNTSNFVCFYMFFMYFEVFPLRDRESQFTSRH